MSSVLEELFAQAATKCSELGDTVDTASTVIEQIVGHSSELDATLKSGAAEVRNALQALAERLERAEADLGDAAGEAEDGLNRAIEEAQEARTALKELSERGDGGSSEIDSVVERVSGELTTGFQTATLEFNEYGDAVADFSKLTADEVATTQEGLKSFADEIDEARDDLETKKEDWLKALDGFTDAVARESREAVEALAAGLKDQATGMLEAGNAVVMDHNEAMGALKAGYSEEAVEALGEALSPVAEALAAVGAAAESREAELSQRVRAAVARIEELAPQIGALSERLLVAKDLREA